MNKNNNNKGFFNSRKTGADKNYVKASNKEKKKKESRRSQMLIPTIVLGVLAVALFLVGYFRGEGEHIVGLKRAWVMTYEILPLIFFAFLLAGMMQVLIPQEVMASWVGEESGLRGILVGTFVGGFMPGGPYVSLPLAAGLLRAGAGVGTMVAFLTSWSLWAISRLPMEIGVMGLRFTLVRLACTFFFPPIAGLIAQAFFSSYK